MMKSQKPSLCPCHSGLPYAGCCQPFHDGQAPPTPVQLMRSRYAAYALGKISYVIKSELSRPPLPSKQMVDHRKGLKHFSKTTNFLGLKIVSEKAVTEDKATVTFQAILMQNGQDASYTEKSTFEKINGRWMYLRPTAS